MDELNVHEQTQPVFKGDCPEVVHILGFRSLSCERISTFKNSARDQLPSYAMVPAQNVQLNAPSSSCNREAMLSSLASAVCFLELLGNMPLNPRCRLVKNKALVSLKLSTSFSASTSHSLVASSSFASIRGQSSCTRCQLC